MTEYREHFPNVSEHLNTHSYNYIKNDNYLPPNVDTVNATFPDNNQTSANDSNLVCHVTDYLNLDRYNDKSNENCNIPTSDTDTTSNFINYNTNTNTIPVINDEFANKPTVWNENVDPVSNAVILQNDYVANGCNTMTNVQLPPNTETSLVDVPIEPSITEVNSTNILPNDQQSTGFEDPLPLPEIENHQLDDETEQPRRVDEPNLITNTEQKQDDSGSNCPSPSSKRETSSVPLKSRKRRRRIVLLNDEGEDSSAEDEEREKILSEPSSPKPDSVDEMENCIDSIPPELLINEKPGPKSKKASTQILKEIQARQLLRTAVVIPAASDSKKRKPRIIDSDEECPSFLGLDDIGLPDNDPNDDSFDENGPSILLNENDNYPLEGIEIDKIDKVVPIENPIIPQSDGFDDGEEMDSGNPLSGNETSGNDNQIESGEHLDDNSDKQDEKMNIGTTFKDEPINEEYNDNSDPIATGQLVNTAVDNDENVKEKYKKTVKFEQSEESEEYVEVEEKLPKKEIIRRKQTDDFFNSFQYSSSNSEDEFIPNDVYFGTPDRTALVLARGSGRPRGRPKRQTSLSRNHMEIVKTVMKTPTVHRGRGGGRGRGRPPLQKRFIDNRSQSSRSSSSESKSSSGSVSSISSYESERENERTIQTPKVKPMGKVTVAKVQSFKGKKKKDRFYDRSRSIPNEIYFGDVEVPLHVLHSYGGSSDSESSESSKEIVPEKKYQQKQPKINITKPTVTNAYRTPGKRGRPPGKKIVSSSSRTTDSLKVYKKFLKAAGLKKVKYNKLWQGCKSQKERVDKILDLLHEKGLEGEPSMQKCKQLKIELMAKKEIEELDTTLILPTEGRTRRSARAATHRNYTYDEDDIPEVTNKKWKKVIDSDSDFD